MTLQHANKHHDDTYSYHIIILSYHTVSQLFKSRFESRACLIYTGKQRLAKNTLINALQKCAMTIVANDNDGDSVNSGDSANATTATSKNMSIIYRLSSAANEAFRQLQALEVDSLQTEAEDVEAYKLVVETAIDNLAKTVNEYWELKKQIAAGSEPGWCNVDAFFSLFLLFLFFLTFFLPAFLLSSFPSFLPTFFLFISFFLPYFFLQYTYMKVPKPRYHNIISC